VRLQRDGEGTGKRIWLTSIDQFKRNSRNSIEFETNRSLSNIVNFSSVKVNDLFGVDMRIDLEVILYTTHYPIMAVGIVCLEMLSKRVGAGVR